MLYRVRNQRLVTDVAFHLCCHYCGANICTCTSCLTLAVLFLSISVPACFQSLDGTVYEKFSSCLASVGRITSEAAQQALTDFQVVRSEAEKVERKFAVRCFMQSNPVMTGVVRHVYSPYKEDPVSIRSSHNCLLYYFHVQSNVTYAGAIYLSKSDIRHCGVLDSYDSLSDKI